MLRYCVSVSFSVTKEACEKSFSAFFEKHGIDYRDVNITGVVENMYSNSLKPTMYNIPLQLMVYVKEVRRHFETNPKLTSHLGEKL